MIQNGQHKETDKLNVLIDNLLKVLRLSRFCVSRLRVSFIFTRLKRYDIKVDKFVIMNAKLITEKYTTYWVIHRQQLPKPAND